MEKVIVHKGDWVCRKKKFTQEYLIVTSAKGNTIECLIPGTTDHLLIARKDIIVYKIKSITVQPGVLKNMVQGRQTIVYGPLIETWKNICVSMIRPVPDIIKINNGWGGHAIFQYVEAARVYKGEEVCVRLEVGSLLSEYEVL